MRKFLQITYINEILENLHLFQSNSTPFNSIICVQNNIEIAQNHPFLSGSLALSFSSDPTVPTSHLFDYKHTQSHKEFKIKLYICHFKSHNLYNIKLQPDNEPILPPHNKYSPIVMRVMIRKVFQTITHITNFYTNLIILSSIFQKNN